MRDKIVKLFFNERGRMRCGWRLALFIGSVFLLSILLSLPASFWGWETFRLNEGRIVFRPNEWAVFLASLLASFTLVKYLEKRPVGSLGLKLHASWWKEFFIGISIGAILQLLLFALMGQNFKVALALDFQQSLLTMINYFRNSVAEELLFRGLPLQILMEGIGVAPAILMTSVFFGLAHVQEQGLLGIISAGSGGILMAVGYLKTRALWIPVGIHFAWNYFLWISERLFESRSTLSDFVEVSVITSYSLVVAIFLLCFRRLKPHPQMEQLWQQYVHPAQPWARLRGWLTNRPKA